MGLLDSIFGAGTYDSIMRFNNEDEAAYQQRMANAKRKITELFTKNPEREEMALYGMNDPQMGYGERAAAREMEGRGALPPLETVNIKDEAPVGLLYSDAKPAMLQNQLPQSQMSNAAMSAPEEAAASSKKAAYQSLQPTIGQYLSNFAGGYQEGGLIGALGNAMRTGESSPNKNKTFDFLVNKGMDAETAQMAVDNPEVLKSVLGGMFAAPKDKELKEIYDSKGNKTQVLMDMKTGQYQPVGGIMNQQQANFDKKYQETLAEDQAKARLGFEPLVNKAQRALDVISGLENHPALDTATGLSSVLDPRNYTPGTDAYDFGTRHKQLEGTSFLEAFEALKGAGAITEIEGRKATDAIMRARQAQSKADYLAAINEVKNVVLNGVRVARRRAGLGDVEGTQSGNQAGGILRVNSFEEARKLPKGTLFIDPQGKERIVP